MTGDEWLEQELRRVETKRYLLLNGEGCPGGDLDDLNLRVVMIRRLRALRGAVFCRDCALRVRCICTRSGEEVLPMEFCSRGVKSDGEE